MSLDLFAKFGNRILLIIRLQMQIPEHQVEEIRANTDIVDLISSFVQLRKRGRNYIVLSTMKKPLHLP